MNTKLTFWEQVRNASGKAATVKTVLNRLIANVTCPRKCKRQLLMSIAQNILLRGTKIWTEALKKKKYRQRMTPV